MSSSSNFTTPMSPLTPPYSPTSVASPMASPISVASQNGSVSYHPRYWSPSMLTYMSPVYIQKASTPPDSVWSKDTAKPLASPIRPKRLYKDMCSESDNTTDHMSIQDAAKLILRLKIPKRSHKKEFIKVEPGFITPIKIKQEFNPEIKQEKTISPIRIQL